MIIQIYAFTKIDQALEAAQLGVDHIGVVAGDYGVVPGELTYEFASRLARALPTKCKSVALTMATDVEKILRMADIVKPNIVHISTDPDDINLENMKFLRTRFMPDIKLMKAIPVQDSESICIARDYAEVSDLLLLDTKVGGMPGVGATGTLHDWTISSRIVAEVKIPVILAGGLTPENVCDAIKTVQPAGVDSNTWTNIKGDPVKKDMAKVRDFVNSVRENV
jgi:phosphoribosylanthranilate isomerase